jgi:hypothetical protein
MESIRILSYRYSRLLNRSIPDKTKVETNQPFTMKEVCEIIRAALIMSAPEQIKRIK